MFNKIDYNTLKQILGTSEMPPSLPGKKSLAKFVMEDDDGPILKYIYRNFNPERHLEFGTWQGTGTFFCLSECNATVWTINLPFGETNRYSFTGEEIFSLNEWAEFSGIDKNNHHTDSIGYTGRFYLEKGLGGRVCQIYSDSRDWDTTNYPNGFFDTCLIDGGHTEEIVINDTIKALPLVRSGGMIMWHDYCPEAESECESVSGVISAVEKMREKLETEMESIYWIYPSWILLGKKK